VEEYFALGFLCVIYWAFWERALLGFLFDLRTSIRNRKWQPPRKAPPPPAGVKLFLAGALAMLILFFWPVYLIMAIGKIGLVVGGSLEPSETLV